MPGDRPEDAVRNAADDLHPIERESFEIVHSLLRLDGWDEGARQVVARVVHATGDTDLARTMVIPESAVTAGANAISRGAPVICDVEMVVAGVRRELNPQCRLGDALAGPGGYPTRSASAMGLAAEEHPQGAVFVIGCAPTALVAICDLIEEGTLRPALVIGTPVGFVGAAESKSRLRDVTARAGVPCISNVGERGGSAMAASVVNAIAGRPADQEGAKSQPVRVLKGAVPTAVAERAGPRTALFLIGHGTRSEAGLEEFNAFVDQVRRVRPSIPVGSGLIELAEPDIDTGMDRIVADGAEQVIAVPVVLLGAGHMKTDGPDALRRARSRHPTVHFHYARDLGVHPLALEVAEERARQAGAATADAVVLVSRGSSDPDANSDLAKVCRLLADRRGIATGGDASKLLGIVEPSFVSLAPPDVPAALDRCLALGARKITLALYFLFTGVLPERAASQAYAWAGLRGGVSLEVAQVLGPDRRIAELAWQRFDEAFAGGVSMNCDVCIYRVALPGYEDRVGEPLPAFEN